MGIRRIGFQLSPDTLDLSVYGVVIYIVRSVSPDLRDKARTRNDVTCAAGEREKNGEFQFRELNRFASSRYSPALDVYGKVADANDVGGLEIRRFKPPLPPE